MANILLVEDYQDLAESLRKRLMMEKHSVEIAHAGSKAQHLIDTRVFDLIILDWDLPEKDGIDICREFRGRGGETPIIMLTGKSEINSKTEGFEAGADDYLTKPFHPAELCARVKALLKRHSASHSVAPNVTSTQVLTGGQQSLIGADLDEKLEIISLIGEGAMGFVYKAKHKLLNKIVAVKVLQPRLTQNPQSLGRFQQEAKAIAALDHQNIIKLYDFSVSPGGLFYIVTEYIEGLSLAQAIRKLGPLPVDRCLPIFMQTADGLSHAHGKGIIHRDIKPSNLMLVPSTSFEILKILDFGLAKSCDNGENAMQLTQTGEVFGSPLYMSPEQCKGSPLDHRTDIFSLGCVMFEALTGQAPYIEESILMTMYKRTAEPAPRMRDVAPTLNIPKEVELVVQTALQRDVNSRYQNAQQLHNDLIALNNFVL
jgi:CheY-like chemotaxis protein